VVFFEETVGETLAGDVEFFFLRGFPDDQWPGRERKLLVPRQFTKLFGTIRVDFYRAILEQLSEAKPDLYRDAAILPTEGEEPTCETLTVRLPALDTVAFETAKNEVVYSFAQNGCSCVVLITTGFESGPTLPKIFSLRDVSVLGFALHPPAEVETLYVPSPEAMTRAEPAAGAAARGLRIALMLSVALNLLLGVRLVAALRRRT
jgi:hypothetical protein